MEARVSAAERLVVVCKVTEACNLGCAFCAYDRNLARPRRFADADRLRKLAPALAAAGVMRGTPVLVSWLGGEPLLWPELESVTETFRAHGLATSVTTNGTTLGSSQSRTRVLDLFDELTVSIDGLGERHDQLRAWPGGFAHLERVLTRLVAERDARGSHLRVRVNTVVMRDNVDQLRALCHRLAGWGVDEITWNQLGGNDRPEFFAAHRLRAPDVARLADVVGRLRSELPSGVRLGGDAAYLDRVRASSKDEAIAVRGCQIERTFLYVSIDGVVSPCSFTNRDLGEPLENLGSAERLLTLPARLAERRDAIAPRACTDCHSTQQFGKFLVPS